MMSDIQMARRLYRVGFDFSFIGRVTHLTDDEVHKTLDEEITAVAEIEKEYRNTEWPKVLASIKEWQEEFPQEWRITVRKDFLRERIEKVRQLFNEGCKEYAQITHEFTYWHVKRLEQLERLLKKLGMEAKILVGKAEGISPEKIAYARKTPITDFVTARQGMTKCPFHLDKSPSLDVRKNFYYCYGCGAHGDVIDFVMRTKNLSFKEAVNLLA